MSGFINIFTQDLGECVSSFDFSPMGDYFAAGLINEQVLVWKYKDMPDLANNLREIY
jgi:hypothetical protein